MHTYSVRGLCVRAIKTYTFSPSSNVFIKVQAKFFKEGLPRETETTLHTHTQQHNRLNKNFVGFFRFSVKQIGKSLSLSHGYGHIRF